VGPALPLDDAGPYVAAAFLVFFALVLVYIAIMARKLQRIERELVELNQLASTREAAGADPAPAREEVPAG
jgi:CcmD family protein